MGLIVQCMLCGTNDDTKVYYIGETSTHCVDCWLLILQALPKFNLAAINARLDKEFGTIDIMAQRAADSSLIQSDQIETLLHAIPLRDLPKVMAAGFKVSSLSERTADPAATMPMPVIKLNG